MKKLNHGDVIGAGWNIKMHDKDIKELRSISDNFLQGMKDLHERELERVGVKRPPPPPPPLPRRIPESALGKRVRERYGLSRSECDDPECTERYSNKLAHQKKEPEMATIQIAIDKISKIIQTLADNQIIMNKNMKNMDARITELEKDLASDQPTMYRSSPRPKTVADLAGNKES